MHRLTRLQLIGPLVLFGTVGAADVTAYALADAPTSAFLWFLNHEVFSIFRKSRAVLEFGGWPFAQLFIASLLVVLALTGLIFRKNLLLAVSSNLSLICAGSLIYSSHYWSAMGKVRAASLAPVQVPTGSDLYFFILLLAGSLVSFAASHYFYFRSMRHRAQ